jgi:hypothetical protein
MPKRLLQCRACHLTWFPQAGAAAACPACGGKEFGTKLQPFHLGIALIALALIGWMRPLLGQALPIERPGATTQRELPTERPLTTTPPGPLGERPVATIPAVIKAKKVTVNVERGPAQGQRVTFRRGDKVTILKREDRRFLVRDRRGNQAYLSSDQVKFRKKARIRRQHVQR